MAGTDGRGPGWTDGNGSDPGFSLLQLLPFLALPLVGALVFRRRRHRRSIP